MKYTLALFVLASLLLYSSIAAADKTILPGVCYPLLILLWKPFPFNQFSPQRI